MQGDMNKSTQGSWGKYTSYNNNVPNYASMF